MKKIYFKKTYIASLVWILSGFVLVSALFYLYLLNETVKHVVARQEAERTLASLDEVVANREVSYLTKRELITLEYAHAQGFEEASDALFITRPFFGRR